jgi:hypothetical protein
MNAEFKTNYKDKLQKLAEDVYNLCTYNAHKDEAEGIGEYLAYEISVLSEWMSTEDVPARAIAKKIINNYSVPTGTSVLVKKYFDLNY